MIYPMSKRAVERAEDADPNGRRCLMENCSNSQAIELAHLLSRDSRENLIASLEWSWGMRKGSLNLDTRENIFFLGASMHQLYKERKWALVPDQDLVSKYHGTFGFPLKRDRFPNIEGNIFQYRFLHLQELQDIHIIRQNTRDLGEGITVHAAPFDDLPIVTSNIHPKYAIVHLGLLLCDSRVPTNPKLIQCCPWLKVVRDLALQWTSTVPDKAHKNVTYNIPPPPDALPDASDNGSCTPPRRIRTTVIPSNTGESEHVSILDSSSTSSVFDHPSPRGKRKRSESSINDTHETFQKKRMLRSRYLARHDADEMYSHIWTAELISRWATDCCPSSPASPPSRKTALRRSARIQAMGKRR